MASLELTNLSLTHAAHSPWAVPALHEINLSLTSGDRVLIVGSNGSGKSSLLSVLAGITDPTTGTCHLDGAPVSDQPDRVGLLLQNTRLQLTRPTVLEELEDMSTSPDHIPAIVRQLGLTAFQRRRIDELSGGQQRRVGLASTILRGADLLLLDEPLAGLDSESTENLLDALGLIRDDAIVVVVTHDLEATRPILNHGRSGRVLRIADGQVSTGEIPDGEATHGARA